MNRRKLRFMACLTALMVVSAASELRPINPVYSASRALEVEDDGRTTASISSTKAATLPNLSAIDMVSSSDGWAAGQYGTILHWNGSQWLEVLSPVSAWLDSVYMISAIDGWIGGGAGTLLRWEGSSWSPVTSPTARIIRSFDLLSDNTDGWAVGGSASEGYRTILRWNGAKWTLFSEGRQTSLYSVSMTSATDGWAVGELGTLLRWNGNTWTRTAAPVAHDLYAVEMLSSTDGWATGGDWFTFDGSILHWDGSEWRVAAEFDDILFDIDFVSGMDGWVAGVRGSLTHWDGTQWTVHVPSDTSFPFIQSVSMISASQGWAVGSRDTIARWDGSNWTYFPHCAPSLCIYWPFIVHN